MDDLNKLHHVFDNPQHNLDVLVRLYGGKASAGRAIIEAIDRVLRAGDLVLSPLGRYWQVFNVGGYPVTVRGRVVNGIARIGSAWIRSEDDDAQA
jgi:hypothetical protein